MIPVPSLLCEYVNDQADSSDIHQNPKEIGWCGRWRSSKAPLSGLLKFLGRTYRKSFFGVIPFVGSWMACTPGLRFYAPKPLQMYVWSGYLWRSGEQVVMATIALPARVAHFNQLVHAPCRLIGFWSMFWLSNNCPPPEGVAETEFGAFLGGASLAINPNKAYNMTCPYAHTSYVYS